MPSLEVLGRAQHEAEVVLVQRQVQQGIAKGEIVDVDPETLTRVLLGAFAEATLHVLTSGRAEDAIEVVDEDVEAVSTNRSQRVTIGNGRTVRYGGMSRRAL